MGREREGVEEKKEIKDTWRISILRVISQTCTVRSASGMCVPDFTYLGLYRIGKTIEKRCRLHHKLVYQQQRVLYRHRLDLCRVIIHLLPMMFVN